MPRKKKKTTTPVETPITPERAADIADSFAAERLNEDVPPSTQSSGLASEELAVFTNSPTTDAPATEAAVNSAPPVSSHTGNESAATPRGRFRSWVSDPARGYSRLTDEQEQRVVLQFAQKPAADVLTAIKGAGFQFLADYEGLNQVWVRRNDFETRLQIEAIEKLIGSTPTRDSASR